MRLPVIVIATALLLTASRVVSGPRIDECGCELGTSCSLRISVCPAGDFEQIRNGCGGDSDYIEVYIRGFGGEGIEGIPPTDFWMNACDAGQSLALCAPPFFQADSSTGPDGRTTFSGLIAAGGCILTGGVYMGCQGVTIMDYESGCTVPACADIVIVSPDINADGFVNLSDLSFFGQSYNYQLGDPGYDPCADFNDDDWCNLSDFSFLGEHYQHECQ